MQIFVQAFRSNQVIHPKGGAEKFQVWNRLSVKKIYYVHQTQNWQADILWTSELPEHWWGLVQRLQRYIRFQKNPQNLQIIQRQVQSRASWQLELLFRQKIHGRWDKHFDEKVAELVWRLRSLSGKGRLKIFERRDHTGLLDNSQAPAGDVVRGRKLREVFTQEQDRVDRRGHYHDDHVLVVPENHGAGQVNCLGSFQQLYFEHQVNSYQGLSGLWFILSLFLLFLIE